MKYKLIFDKVILKQFKKARKNKQVKDILSRMFDKIEEKGPNAGKLIDVRLKIHEMKSKYPPIRLYFKHANNDEIYVFEYEMKTSEKKQRNTIQRLKNKISKILHLFL